MPLHSTLPPPVAVPCGNVPRLDAPALVRLTGLFLISRLLVVAVAALSHLAVAQGGFRTSGQTWAERFANWDAGWYLGLASGGYFYDVQHPSNVAFYPLYPLLIRAATALGCNPLLAGYAISLAALYVGCLLLWRLTARETRSASTAERAVLFLLVCPGTMWFGMIYTESLFLLTMLGCLLSARRGRWIAAGLWGMTAALTRTPGLLLAGFLFLEAAQQWWERRRLRAPSAPPDPGVPARAAGVRGWRVLRWPWLTRAALAILGPVAGQATFLIFLQIRFGDWRAQQKTVAAAWGGGFRWPWEALAIQWQHLDAIYLDIYLPLLGIVLATAVVGLFTLKRASYAALALALAVLYVSTTPGDATTRYLCTTVPAYIVLAQLAERSRVLEVLVLLFSVAVMTILTVLRANGYHII